MCRQIPQYGNRSEVVLKVLHRSYLGGDEFLGQVSLPLQDFDVYEKPKAKYGDTETEANIGGCIDSCYCRWYPLTCKPGQNKPGYRGELEVNDTLNLAENI